MDVLYIKLSDECDSPATHFRRHGDKVHVIEPAIDAVVLQLAGRCLDAHPFDLVVIAETRPNPKPDADWQLRNVIHGLRQSGRQQPIIALTTPIIETAAVALIKAGANIPLMLRLQQAAETTPHPVPGSAYVIRSDLLLSTAKNLVAIGATGVLGTEAALAVERQIRELSAGEIENLERKNQRLRRDLAAALQAHGTDKTALAAVRQELGLEAAAHATAREDNLRLTAALAETRQAREADQAALAAEKRDRRSETAALSDQLSSVRDELTAEQRQRAALQERNEALQARVAGLASELTRAKRTRRATAKPAAGTPASLPGFYGLVQNAPGEFQFFDIPLNLKPRGRKILAQHLEAPTQVRTLDDMRAYAYGPDAKISHGTVRSAISELNLDIRKDLGDNGVTFNLPVIEPVFNTGGYHLSTVNLRQLAQKMAPDVLLPDIVKPNTLKSSEARDIFRFVGFSTHWDSAGLWYKGHPIPIAHKSKLVVISLLEAKGKVVTRETLYEKCGWAAEGVVDTVVAPAVHRAQAALVDELVNLHFEVPKQLIQYHRYSDAMRPNGWSVDVAAIGAINVPQAPRIPGYGPLGAVYQHS